MLGRLALALVVGVSLSGCQYAIPALILYGLDATSDALGIRASIQESIRAQTGGCVTWYLKPIPCPPPQEPAKP